MIRRWLVKLYVRRAYKTLARLNDAMAAAGLTRSERRRVWREVIAGRLDPNDLIG